MSRYSFLFCAFLLVALTYTGGVSAANTEFGDPLDTPAIQQVDLTSQPMLSVTTAGSRIIAVGLRGLIIASKDGGKTWRQIHSPVQADLTSVYFLNAKAGWIVGHGGVILHSGDGGQTWKKQFDGRQMKQFVTLYKHEATQGAPNAKRYLRVMKENIHYGPELPFMGILFLDSKTGYAVGPFGLLVHTSDGGDSWHPWLAHIANLQFFHLNSINEIGNRVFIAGEKGRIYMLNSDKHYFENRSPHYKGSFFGVIGSGTNLVAYGLQGTVYRSTNDGESWQKIEAGLIATATAGTVLNDGRYLLLSEDGHGVISSDDGKSFSPFSVQEPMNFADVIEVHNNLIMVGLGGVYVQPLH